MTLDDTKLMISFMSFFDWKLFDSNTKSLFVMNAKATASTQAMVFDIISPILKV